ncbi:aKG-HExxH-type peptide beta-hydroxylase [Methylobacterium durans]|uniref:HEXXH motif domain-containing protein n=1 Tax=Methylobacterium durans TaxID=2202825 RepID=A0A2U8W8Q7_9HYPH|nr:HEXXH motif-containing putative peptide modification protein [Methylobacterium durans]AWN42513.1 hypothetical protein DK389_20930 [Methylobacterium durans]
MSTDADLVHAVLDVRNARWFPGLAGALARSRWDAVQAATGLTRAAYGTARYLAGDPGLPRDDLLAFEPPAEFRAAAPMAVETLHGAVSRRYAELGLEFHAPGLLDAGRLRVRLDAAFRRLGEVPDAAAAIGAVLAVLHVAKPAGPDYDVSYSDPVLPFSIFVGIDAADQAHGDLRLAEGILHECMHLQLTLIEAAVPMVAGTDERHHSPWQGTLRPAQGVLHGLYVFRVIQDFHRALLDGGRCTVDERAYLARRVRTIMEEVGVLGDLSASRDLTMAGRRLATALLAA